MEEIEKTKKPIGSSIAVLISVIALVLAGVAWQRSSQVTTSTAQDTLARALSTGKINVCYAAYPPSIIKDDKTGEITGHDIETLQAMLNSINVKPNFVESSWGSMVGALQSGTCDVIPGLFALPARAAAIAFSDPVYYVGQVAVAKKGEARFQKIGDLNDPSVTIAVINGESGNIYAREHLPKAKLAIIDIEGPDVARVFSEIVAGRADAVIIDADTASDYIKVHPDAIKLYNGEAFGLNPASFAVRQGDVGLLQFLNSSIRFLDVNGTLDELYAKYNSVRLREIKTYGSK